MTTQVFQTKHSTSEFREMAYDNTILRAQVGSGLYGLAIEGTDDRDEMGICIEPKRYVIGLDSFEQYEFRTQPQGVRSGPNDLDLNIYSLRKWMRLALAGNPTVLMLLFAPDDELVEASWSGLELRKHTAWFISKDTGRRFQGYMRAQREKMLGQRGGSTNRPELIERYGYDTKFASHMLRLGLQGCELLSVGTITLPMAEPDRQYVRDVKLGKYTRDECVATAFELEMRLQALIETGPVPEKSNYAAATALMIEMYQEHWDSRG